MTEGLKEMVRTYKENGDRVDEVLYQEVNSVVARLEYLQEALTVKNEKEGGVNEVS